MIAHVISFVDQAKTPRGMMLRQLSTAILSFLAAVHAGRSCASADPSPPHRQSSIKASSPVAAADGSAPTWNGYFWRAKRYAPFLNRDVTIDIVTSGANTPPAPRQLALLSGVEKIPPSLIDKIDDAAERHRAEIDAAVDLASYGLGHIKRANIRNHYRIEAIVIPELGGSDDRYYFLLAECDWEEEHGMEILLRNDAIVLCGLQNGLFLSQEWHKYISPSGPAVK